MFFLYHVHTKHGKPHRLNTLCFVRPILLCQSDMAARAVPDILRSSLASVTMQLKALGVADILAFDFMDRPPQASIERALRVLYDLGCLDDAGAYVRPWRGQSYGTNQ